LIIGIGTDLVEISRVRRFLERDSGRRFMERVLTPAELELATNRQGRLAEFVAGRFAAKEAVVKALGTGIGGITGFHDVEVLPCEGGRPTVVLSEAAMERLGLNRGTRIHLSITHTSEMAAAYAVVEANKGHLPSMN
jgi:holo-[acyl-carrier protein] synthase